MKLLDFGVPNLHGDGQGEAVVAKSKGNDIQRKSK